MANFKLFRKKTNFFPLVGILLFLFIFRNSQILFAASPSVTTGSASSITKTTAFISGAVPGNGGADITEVGFNYGATVGYGSTITANTRYVFNSKFGPSGSTEGQLDEPYGIAIDSSGNFYIADSGNNRIQKFNSSGVFVSMFGWGVDDGSAAFQTCTSGCQAGSAGNGDGQFDTPFGVTVDSDGNIYVADTSNSRIQKFNSSFVFQYKFGTFGTGENQFNTPAGMAIDSGGNIYVTDANNYRLQKFNSSGVFVSMFGWGVDDGSAAFQTCTSGCQAGSAGNGAGQFNQPIGIDIDSSGNIYIADLGKHRVQKFNSSVTYTGQLGTTATASGSNGQFNGPIGVFIDEYDNIFVTESTGARVQKFNSSGTYVTKFGSFGGTDGLFNAAFGVVVDTSGNIFVTDFNVPRVQKFSLSIDSTQITGLTCNTTYHFQAYATNSDGTAFGSDNTFTTSACDVPDVDTVPATAISQTAATLNGVYVYIPGGVGITRGFEYGLTTSYGTTLSENGNEYVSQFGSSGSTDGLFNAPQGITLDASGNIYVADSGNNRVQKFSASGSWLATILGNAGDFNMPSSVAIDASGNIYVADVGNNRIQKFDSSGVFQLEIGTGLFGAAFTIAIDSSDTIFVADTNNSRVMRYDSSGVDLGEFGLGEFTSPVSIDFDSSDNIYIADVGQNSVKKFDSSGSYITDAVSGNLAAASTIAIDSNDNIYVANPDFGQVFKYDSIGTLVYTFNGNGFNLVVSVVVDSNGNIFVVDSGANNVQEYSLNFSWDVSSLTCGTDYHFRALATNGDGAGYGADEMFTTSACDGGGGPTRIYGCTNPTALNYNIQATHDDGSCVFVDPPEVSGCTDPDATNYNSNADIDDGSCTYDPGAIPGCTDPLAGNYSDEYTVDDGSCEYDVYGCTNPTATNFNPIATINDGTCHYDGPIEPEDPIYGCMNPGATNYDDTAEIDDGSCNYVTPIVYGCTDTNATNFNAGANEDDGSCAYIDIPDDPTDPIDEGSSGFFEKTPDNTLLILAISGLALPSIFQPELILALLSLPLRLWNLIPIIMGYRRKKRPWGTVYDSVTKQPLDPVYVTLKTISGQDQATSITDIDGRYGFLAPSGTYTISAGKDNYVFPSVKLAGKTEDELYDNLYFGAPIEVTEKEGVVFKNIPMDAINFNWNEFAKAKNKKLMKFYSKRDIFFARTANLLFIVGLISSVVLFALDISLLNYVVLALYAFILALRFLGIKPKQGGYAYDIDGTPLSFGIIRLFSAGLDREVAHTVVGKTGRYYLLVANGDYYMKISRKVSEDGYEDVLTTEPFAVKGGCVKKRIAL